ncbi:MAG TPA: DoxX family protein [Stellaceae bacterium]|nr:DoxX family protein [Stellaceae bacterium]
MRETDSIKLSASDWGVLLLRLSLGIMFLAHSIVLKLLTYGLGGTAQFFVGVGLPAWLAYAVFTAEAVGGVLLVLGIQSRWVALTLSPILLGALFTVHLANGWVFTSPNGGWGYPAYLFVLCIAQVLLGDEPYALRASAPLPGAIDCAVPVGSR